MQLVTIYCKNMFFFSDRYERGQYASDPLFDTQNSCTRGGTGSCVVGRASAPRRSPAAQPVLQSRLARVSQSKHCQHAVRLPFYRRPALLLRRLLFRLQHRLPRLLRPGRAQLFTPQRQDQILDLLEFGELIFRNLFLVHTYIYVL